MIDADLVKRMTAHLLRFEGVSPQAIERAVVSAQDMMIGSSVTLSDDDPTRRAFINEQINLLERAS